MAAKQQYSGIAAVGRLLAHRDQFFRKDLTSAFEAKRKWALRQSPLSRSKMTRLGSEACIAAIEMSA